MSGWSYIPVEILIMIFSYLNIDNLNTICDVCEQWRKAGRMTKTVQIVRDNQSFMWKNLGKP